MCYLALGVIGVCITPGRNGFGYGGDITHCSNSYCLIILDVPLPTHAEHNDLGFEMAPFERGGSVLEAGSSQSRE